MEELVALFVFSFLDVLKMKEDNLISTLDRLNDSFHANVFKRNSRHPIKTVLWTALFILHIVSGLVLEDENLRRMFFDPAIYALPKGELQPIGGRISVLFRCYLIIALYWHHFDNHQWLYEANKIFHQIESIRIPPNINKRIRRMKFLSFFSAFGILFALSFLSGMNIFFIGTFSDTKPIDYVNGLLLAPAVNAIGIYYSGIFFSKFYLFLKLTEDFSTQFTKYYRKKIRQSSSILTTKIITEQFRKLYFLIQHLNFFNSYAYIMFGVVVFFYSANLIFLTFFTSAILSVKIVCGIVFISLVFYIFFISEKAGHVDDQAKKLSVLIYENVTVNQTISAPPNQYNRYRLQVRCFKTAQSNTVFFRSTITLSTRPVLQLACK